MLCSVNSHVYYKTVTLLVLTAVVITSGGIFRRLIKAYTRMFYACSVGARVLVSSGAAKLAWPASNFASHGRPFSKGRLEWYIGLTGEPLINLDLSTSLN